MILNNHFEYALHWNESRSQVLIRNLRLFKARFLRFNNWYLCLVIISKMHGPFWSGGKKTKWYNPQLQKSAYLPFFSVSNLLKNINYHADNLERIIIFLMHNHKIPSILVEVIPITIPKWYLCINYTIFK